VIYKILSNIILKRLNVYAEEIVGEYQCVFWPNRNTIDQIFVMRQTMEKCYEYNTDLHMFFFISGKLFTAYIETNYLWP
jgi:hypothetical protein